MWIPKRFVARLEQDVQETKTEQHKWMERALKAESEISRLLSENVTLKSNQEWFKLRLNSVERERAQLIFAACGQKIAVPEFVPTYEAPETALGEQPDFAAVGGDARSEADYTLMPARENN